MCSYQARALGGAVVEVAPTHRITSVAGQPYELYLIDVQPCPVGDVTPWLGFTERVVIEPLTYTGGVVTAGPAKTFDAQVEWKAARRHGSDRTPDKPAAAGSLIVLASNQKQVSKLLQLDFADSLAGKAFAHCYSLAGVNETFTGARPNAGDPGTATADPKPLVYDQLDLNTQYDPTTPGVIIGDLCLTIDRERVTEAQLKKFAYFTLTPQGGQPQRYTLWADKGSLKALNTHHWALYLRRHK